MTKETPKRVILEHHIGGRVYLSPNAFPLEKYAIRGGHRVEIRHLNPGKNDRGTPMLEGTYNIITNDYVPLQDFKSVTKEELEIIRRNAAIAKELYPKCIAAGLTERATIVAYLDHIENLEIQEEDNRSVEVEVIEKIKKPSRKSRKPEFYWDDKCNEHCIEFIREFSEGAIVGSVTWMTDPAIFDELSKIPRVALLTQKEDFLSSSNFRHIVNYYNNAKNLFRWNEEILWCTNIPEKEQWKHKLLDAIRCYGFFSEEQGRGASPLAHGKLLIGLKDCSSEKKRGFAPAKKCADKTQRKLYRPRGIFQGSYNATYYGRQDNNTICIYHDEEKSMELFLKFWKYYLKSESFNWRNAKMKDLVKLDPAYYNEEIQKLEKQLEDSNRILESKQGQKVTKALTNKQESEERLKRLKAIVK